MARLFRGVQLAKKYEPGGRPLAFPVLIEPKYDGTRVTIIVSDKVGDHVYTRRGIDYISKLSFFCRQIRQARLREVMVDGELLAKTWGATSAMLHEKEERKTEEQRKGAAKLYVFDVMKLSDYLHGGSSLPLLARRKTLRRLRGQPNIRIVPAKVARSPRDIEIAYRYYLKRGFEGVMIKDPRAEYVLTRSSSWLKWKPVQTEDAQIIGFQEGIGKYEGMLGALIAKIISGKNKGARVKIGGGFSDAERRKFWRTRKSLLGQKVEFKFQKETGKTSVSKSARNPVFLHLRNDI